MRQTFPFAIAAAILIGTAPLGAPLLSPALAQGQGAAPTQVELTQALIDDAVAAQKDVRAAEGNGDQGKEGGADPAKLTAAAKKHGFESLKQFGDVSYTIGIVMSGIDPETKSYVGAAPLIRKQIKQVQSDASMPAKDKKAALEDLNGELQQVGTEKASPSNIDLVKANFDKLSQAM